MSYLVLSRNGEESCDQFLNPDPDHLRGRPNHGYIPSCVNILCKQIKTIGAIVFELRARTDKQTDPNALPSHSSPGARENVGGKYCEGFSMSNIKQLMYKQFKHIDTTMWGELCRPANHTVLVGQSRFFVSC